ncbi:MAG: hypothetical protein ACXW5J_24945 [Thermoanaerobaculia bacterium]
MKTTPALLVATLAIAGVAYAASDRVPDRKVAATASSELVETPANDPWRLRARVPQEISSDVERWANGHFAQPTEIAGPAGADEVRPVLPLRAVETVEFEVLAIPAHRRMAGYEDAIAPVYYAVNLLRDERGNLYHAVVEETESGVFAVQAVGPLLDRDPAVLDRPVEARRLEHLPRVSGGPRRVTALGTAQQPRRVLIPYPYAMDQLYLQYGPDPATATFESVWTGETYTGLEAVLSGVDAEWAKLGSVDDDEGPQTEKRHDIVDPDRRP